jgi:hypothetical protein
VLLKCQLLHHHNPIEVDDEVFKIQSIDLVDYAVDDDVVGMMWLEGGETSVEDESKPDKRRSDG